MLNYVLFFDLEALSVWVWFYNLILLETFGFETVLYCPLTHRYLCACCFGGPGKWEGRDRGQNKPVSVRNKVRNLDQSHFLLLVFIFVSVVFPNTNNTMKNKKWTNDPSAHGSVEVVHSAVHHQIMQPVIGANHFRLSFDFLRIRLEKVPNRKYLTVGKTWEVIGQTFCLSLSKWTNGQNRQCDAFCRPVGAVLHMSWVRFTKLSENVFTTEEKPLSSFCHCIDHAHLSAGALLLLHTSLWLLSWFRYRWRTNHPF